MQGTNTALYHKAYSGSWSGWQQIGGLGVCSAPAVASWASGRLDVFSVADLVFHDFYNGSSWQGPEDLGGGSYSSSGYFGASDCVALEEAPAAVSWGPNRIDVFVRGTDSRLYHLVWQ